MEHLEGGDISIEHFLQDHQDFSSNNLQKMFQDSSILITGVTGILGSHVLEKLLRCCPNLSKVYVTVRGKEGKSANWRLEQLFSTKLFDRVKLEQRESLSKVEMLDSDDGLETHSMAVKSSINMLIHCALVVDPLKSLKEAVQANIKNTSELLQMAYSCHKLEAFIVVTSTLCHTRKGIVEEKFYSPVVKAKTMCIICDSLPSSMFECDTSGLICRESSASYISLGVVEDLIRDGRKSLPIAIVRPSMLVASYQQPLAGWLPRSPQGLMRVLTQAMQGRLCTLCLDSSLSAELMPTDLAASHVLAVTAHTASISKNWKNREVESAEDSNSIIPDSEIPIFNLVSSNHSPISWQEFFVCSIRHARSVPFLDTAWYPHLIMTESYFLFSLWFFILHLLPAWCIDRYYKFREKSTILNTKMSGVYDKYESLRNCCEGLKMHTLQTQKYVDHNTQALWRCMGPSDKETFNFHLSQLDWDQYLYTLARGVRLYCLCDSLDTVPTAATRMSRLKLLHYSCVVMSSFLVLLILRFILKLLVF